MTTQWLTFEQMDATLNQWLPESVSCEAFEDPEPGNGFAPILTIVKHGEPGRVVTTPERFADYGAAVSAAYRIAQDKFPAARVIEVTSED